MGLCRSKGWPYWAAHQRRAAAVAAAATAGRTQRLLALVPASWEAESIHLIYLGPWTVEHPMRRVLRAASSGNTTCLRAGP